MAINLTVIILIKQRSCFVQTFYDRKNELASLDEIRVQAKTFACFTVVIGRRRIGKTELLKHFLKTKCKKNQSAYLFTARSSEPVLCQQWQKDLEEQLSLKIFGQTATLHELFEQIFVFSESHSFTLVVDEFQDLENVNRAFFSQLQNLWDSYKGRSKINLIVAGSAFSMMTRIFQDAKEPLFGRATHHIHLKPFAPSAVKAILADFNPRYTSEDLLCLYMLSGGVAKYIFLLMEAKAATKKKMLEYVARSTSPFLTDGKEILVSEIGKDYGTYFSILGLVSAGLTSQSEIDSVIKKNCGSYLQNLEKTFSAVRPVRPLFSKPGSRNVRYQISDSYLRFYFRFVWANQSLVELGQLDSLKEIILRDYETFSGKSLEEYFAEKISEEKKMTQIGGWWDKKSQNEIDIIALNAVSKNAEIIEVKRSKKKIDLKSLEQKAESVKANLSGYKISLKGLSMDDM